MARKLRKGDDDMEDRRDDKDLDKGDDDDGDKPWDDKKSRVSKADGDDDDDKDKKDDAPPWLKDKMDKKSRVSKADASDNDPRSQDESEDQGEDAGADNVDKKSARKSVDVSVDDLVKSMRMLNQYRQYHDPVDRKEALLSKARDGRLDPGERKELFGLLEGRDMNKSRDNGRSLAKSMVGNETLRKNLDVSEYLRELNNEICASVDGLTDMVKSHAGGQNEFNLVLAKAVCDVGRLVKSVNDRLAVYEGQPARGPRSVGAQPLAKSFAGAPAAGGAAGGQQLNKSQVLDVLTELNRLSFEKGGTNGLTKGGAEEYTTAIAKYESTNTLSKSLEDEVVGYVRQNRAR